MDAATYEKDVQRKAAATGADVRWSLESLRLSRYGDRRFAQFAMVVSPSYENHGSEQLDGDCRYHDLWTKPLG